MTISPAISVGDSQRNLLCAGAWGKVVSYTIYYINGRRLRTLSDDIPIHNHLGP